MLITLLMNYHVKFGIYKKLSCCREAARIVENFANLYIRSCEITPLRVFFTYTVSEIFNIE